LTLRIENLEFTYPGWPPTLRGASLAVPAGESGFLLGPSGSGKSTLLRCVAGLERDYRGTIRWNDDPLDPLAPHARRVGMLFQEPALFPHLSVRENVAFGMRYQGIPRDRERAEAQSWLALVELAGKADARPDELSGGERQRVALARTLAARPRAVLLDEPMSALDRDLRDELAPRVKALLAERKVAALWVTHDRDEARRLADRLWTLVDGRCVEGLPEARA